MHGPINVKSPNNINKWHMGFNSAFKGLTLVLVTYAHVWTRAAAGVWEDRTKAIRTGACYYSFVLTYAKRYRMKRIAAMYII
jgi:hypothetical protein